MTLAERLSDLSDTFSNQFYWTELDGFPPLYQLAENEGFYKLNYGPDLSSWIIYSPDWSKYSFGFLSNGNIIVCSGAENGEVAKRAIHDCLDTLSVSGELKNKTEKVDSVEALELDLELPRAYNVDLSADWSITVDYDIRKKRKIQQTLTNGPVDVLEIQEFGSNKPVPVAYRDEYVYVGSRRYEYARSFDEYCTVAYSQDEALLFTKEKMTATIEVTRPTTACISNTGVALIGGDLSTPTQSGCSRGSEELEIEFEIGTPDYDELDEEIAVYSLYGDQLHSSTVSTRVLDSDISNNGEYAAILTGTHEISQVRIYDAEDLTVLLDHETRDVHPSFLGKLKQGVQVKHTDAGYRVYLSETTDDDPTYAIDLDGNIVWKSDTRVLREDIGPLLTKIENPEQNVSSLKHNYESRAEAISQLETIASRHPAVLEGHVDHLITILNQGKLPVNKTKGSKQESVEASASTALLFSNIGLVPQLITPHLDTLSSLAQHSSNPTVKQAASDCLQSAAKESDEVSKELVSHLAPAFETAPVPVEVIRIFEDRLNDLIAENPNKSGTIAEQIQITTDIDEQKELFRVLKKNISLNQPEEVRAPLATPVAETYIELVDEYLNTNHDNIVTSRSYAKALYGDVKTVLERVIDTQPELFSDLTQPLLEQCLAAKKTNSYASPGDPSSLLQLGCVLAESTVRSELIQSHSKIDRVVFETDEPASVDILYCIGDEWAQGRLEELADKTPDENHIDQKVSQIQERAITALQLFYNDKKIDPVIDELDSVAARTDTIYSNIDPLSECVMKLRLQYCYDHLQKLGSAMRGDFEQYVHEKNQNLIGDFDTWWDQVRNGLALLPDVQLDGDTYSYIREQ
jgi:hypothetical protein